MSNHEAGHKFLARLGKQRLRPGGRKATEWLLNQAGFRQDSIVLEVACNMGTTAMEIARRFGCQVIGVDMDNAALQKAQENVAANGLSSQVTIKQANALELPFPDNHFDVVINEAMLTMYADKAKSRIIAEYYRVLKPGGRLITHDIMLLSEKDSGALQAVEQMHKAINVHAQPMLRERWVALFQACGFSKVHYDHGAMTLLTPQGLIYDEGLTGAARIVKNALKKENRSMFFNMFHTFRRNRNQLNYIAVCSTK
ncbi:class I SAM-dependent methyltransferase [Samsonia erythrinae]|uniref:Methyltransferase family protein n=1 Tax=Samsonia erythrinae TaxID=160434 RepID=A0A4R3VS85_9GAMM|nr:class I SAM-dependent methyltransferase [Samsonia erythrinae]TCV06802.1 methyltransferase family protein [Samsonia erythrinae]